MPLLVRVMASLLSLGLSALPTAAQRFETKAAQAFMLDAETGTVLFAKNADDRFPPASLTKLMTAELVFNALKSGRLSLQDEFTVSEHAWRTGGAPSGTATMFAAVKSSVPIEALVQGITVHLANDACIVLAEGLAGTEESFARRMNERARAIGLENSTFVNPTGLPQEGQQSTARDMTILARHLWREYPDYYPYFAVPDFEWNRIRQRNRNPLLPMGIGADGLATGYTEGVGYAIVASATRGDRRLFAVLAGLSSESERADEARKMLEWGMIAYEKRQIFADGEIIGEARVYGGAEATIPVRTTGPVSVFMPTDDSVELAATVVYTGPLPAPVEEGTQVGTLQFWIDGTLSREMPVFAARTVERGTLGQRAMGAVQELLIGWMR